MSIPSKIKIIILFIVIPGLLLSQDGVLKIKSDNAQVSEDESVKIPVLKNDNLKDSNPSIEIMTEPELGVVQVLDGKILYTPKPNVSGVDKFDYKVDTFDGSGTAQVRVNISPVNDAPTGLSLSENSVLENAAAGKIIGRLQVEDPDADDKFKFGLSKDSRDDFTLDGSNLLTKRPFDYEKEKSFTISIQVTDS